LALFGDMVMAMITVTWATGMISTSPSPGYQLNLALAALALTATLMGAGRFSVDAFIARALSRGRKVDSRKANLARPSSASTTTA
jgi:uncharacterized membrane protein YphA (DoxX/SURF4 family)